jgi:hypothetical protein
MSLNRIVGEKLPLSIATAIPFEEVITNDQKKPDVLILSVRTLLRNFLGSVPKDVVPSVRDVVAEFNDEIDLIESYCKMQRVTLLLYSTDYSKITNRFPKAIRPDTWDKKIELNGWYDVIMKHGNIQSTLLDVSVNLPSRPIAKEYIMTSFAIDLLVIGANAGTRLLESHTGAIKQKFEWITKLTDNKQYHGLPFNTLTYQLLGDKSYTNKGASVKLRKVLLEVANKRKLKPYSSLFACKTALQNERQKIKEVEEILKYI